MTRPRGYIPHWNPPRKSLALLADINGVLVDYAEHLPITLRQLFYRLVATKNYPKDEKACKRLGELVSKARRAGRLRWEDFRDDGFVRLEPEEYDDLGEFIAVTRAAARHYRRRRQAGQARRLVVWCEAAGMAPQLAQVAGAFGVPVYSSGGFDSVTVKREAAIAFARLGAVDLLHIGDHDPSGVHMYSSFDEDMQAFLQAEGGDVRCTRLAVTPAQIRAYNLPTSPPKATDGRRFTGQTVQAEALPPGELAAILRTALEARLDPDLRLGVIAQETEDRARLLAALATVVLPKPGGLTP